MLEVELLPLTQVVVIRLLTLQGPSKDGRLRYPYKAETINLPLSLMPTLIGKGQEILLSEMSKSIASLQEEAERQRSLRDAEKAEQPTASAP